MTSDGSAITRLHRAIANPRASAMQIRAIVAELPGPVALEDALAILLALIDREPETFPRAAARWGGRLVLERRLPLVDAQLTLAALAALPGPGAGAGAEALIELSERYGLRRVDELVGDWLRTRWTRLRGVRAITLACAGRGARRRRDEGRFDAVGQSAGELGGLLEHVDVGALGPAGEVRDAVGARVQPGGLSAAPGDRLGDQLALGVGELGGLVVLGHERMREFVDGGDTRPLGSRRSATTIVLALVSQRPSAPPASPTVNM